MIVIVDMVDSFLDDMFHALVGMVGLATRKNPLITEADTREKVLQALERYCKVHGREKVGWRCSYMEEQEFAEFFHAAWEAAHQNN